MTAAPRIIPPHWALRLRPGRRPFDAARWLAGRQDVRGGHACTIRGLLRIGPWQLVALRYRPGRVDPPASERSWAGRSRVHDCSTLEVSGVNR